MLATQGVKKGMADKALAALAEQGKVVCKEFGKTKLYIPQQEGLAALSAEEAAAQAADNARIRKECNAEEAAVAGLRKGVAEAQAMPTVEGMRARLDTLREQCAAADAKLSALRSGAVLDFGAALGWWSKFKGAFSSVWGGVSENMDGKEADLLAEMGVETDQAVKLSIAEFRAMLQARAIGARNSAVLAHARLCRTCLTALRASRAVLDALPRGAELRCLSASLLTYLQLACIGSCCRGHQPVVTRQGGVGVGCSRGWATADASAQARTTVGPNNKTITEHAERLEAMEAVPPQAEVVDGRIQHVDAPLALRTPVPASGPAAPACPAAPAGTRHASSAATVGCLDLPPPSKLLRSPDGTAVAAAHGGPAAAPALPSPRPAAHGEGGESSEGGDGGIGGAEPGSAAAPARPSQLASSPCPAASSAPGELWLERLPSEPGIAAVDELPGCGRSRAPAVHPQLGPEVAWRAEGRVLCAVVSPWRGPAAAGDRVDALLLDAGAGPWAGASRSTVPGACPSGRLWAALTEQLRLLQRDLLYVPGEQPGTAHAAACVEAFERYVVQAVEGKKGGAGDMALLGAAAADRPPNPADQPPNLADRPPTPPGRAELHLLAGAGAATRYDTAGGPLGPGARRSAAAADGQRVRRGTSGGS
eukprot:scaffold36.g5064.t1